MKRKKGAVLTIKHPSIFEKSSLHFWTIFSTISLHWAAFRVHLSFTTFHHWSTIHWADIPAISSFHWHTGIRSKLFSPVLVPFSHAHGFFCPVTIRRAKFSWTTRLRHWASLRVLSSWANHVFTTIHWTIIIAISIFHWDTEISSHLLGPVLIPFSRAHYFFFPVTIYWFKFLGLNCNSQCKK